jgi:hypothetical protein
MAKLTTKRRNSLKKSQFGLPGSRKYPMPDRAHAANAKARATQQYNKGRISKSTKNKIHAKANRVLRRGRKR